MHMNRNVKEILHDTLQELLEDQFKEFKWRLKNTKYYERKIPAAKLEKAEVIHVVDCMCNFYGENKAPTVCINVLKTINLKDVADNLEKTVENGKKRFDCSKRRPSSVYFCSRGALATNGKRMNSPLS